MVHSTDCIISACNNPDEIENTKKQIRENYGDGVRFFVYDKCSTDHSKNDPDVIHLPNTGREQHTYAYHVYNHYNDLADKVIFTPANIEGHRSNRAEFINQNHHDDFDCIFKNYTAYDKKNWKKSEYEGRSLDKAKPQGLKNWSCTHIGAYLPDTPTKTTHLCGNGTFQSTRDLIQKTSKEHFKHIYEELDVNEPEAGHYMERLPQLVYGGVREDNCNIDA